MIEPRMEREAKVQATVSEIMRMHKENDLHAMMLALRAFANVVELWQREEKEFKNVNDAIYGRG